MDFKIESSNFWFVWAPKIQIWSRTSYFECELWSNDWNSTGLGFRYCIEKWSFGTHEEATRQTMNLIDSGADPAKISASIGDFSLGIVTWQTEIWFKTIRISPKRPTQLDISWYGKGEFYHLANISTWIVPFALFHLVILSNIPIRSGRFNPNRPPR